MEVGNKAGRQRSTMLLTLIGAWGLIKDTALDHCFENLAVLGPEAGAAAPCGELGLRHRPKWVTVFALKRHVPHWAWCLELCTYTLEQHRKPRIHLRVALRAKQGRLWMSTSDLTCKRSTILEPTDCRSRGRSSANDNSARRTHSCQARHSRRRQDVSHLCGSSTSSPRIWRNDSTSSAVRASPSTYGIWNSWSGRWRVTAHSSAG